MGERLLKVHDGADEREQHDRRERVPEAAHRVVQREVLLLDDQVDEQVDQERADCRESVYVAEY